jgi:inner membrane protein
VEWGEPYLAMSVEDVRGIVGTPTVVVNGAPETMLQGAESTMGWQPNLRVPLRGVKELKGHMEFTIDMDLAGTEQLSVAPVGDSNHVELSSTWRSPLFAGRFLPRTREVGGNGFSAAWDVSSLATGTQVQMESNPVKPIDLMNVSLLTPIDPYKLSDRATKYGILFVVLTFGGFFLFEMMKELPIHPVQYLLVGFGLAIFFLLLVSFSEHMAFALSYLIASAACIGLLTFYLSHVLRSVTRGVAFGGMLTALYGAVYGLLISEDNALILGSLMLFAVLAVVMVVTRKVDWYKGRSHLVKVATAPPPMQGLGL